MKYYVSVFLTIWSFLTFGQKYETIRYFNQSNGLNSEIIYNIEEDKNNYFWMSTDNGILKYNGNSFKKFTIKNGLPSNDIFKIKIDSKNRIWLTGYYHGLYYIYKDKVVKVKKSDKYNTLEFLYEHKDTLFFKNQYFENITYLTKNSNTLQSLPIHLKKSRIMIFENKNLEIFKNSKNNNFFIIYKKTKIDVPNGYIFYPNLSSTVPTFVKDPNIPNYHSLNRIINNDIIFFKEGKWYKLLKNIADKKVKILSKDLENKYTFLSVSKNKIIVLKDNNYDTKLSNVYSNLPIDLEKIYFTFVDRLNNIWVITNSNQLIFIPKNYLQVASFKNQSIFGESPSTIKYGSHYEDKFFLITNDNEFGVFDKKNKKYFIIDTYKNEIPYKTLVDEKYLILCTNNSHYYYNLNNFTFIKKCNADSNKNSKIIEKQLIHSRGGSLKTGNSTILCIKNSIRFKDFIKINDTYYCSNENFIIAKSSKENFYKKRDLKYINVIEKYKDLIIAGTNSNGLFLINKNLEIVYKVDNNNNICDIKVVKNTVYVLTTNALYIYQIGNNKLKLIKVKTNKDGILDSRNKHVDIDANNIYIFSQLGITILDKNNINVTSNSEIDFECLEFPINTNEIINLERENNTLNFLFNVRSFENENNFKRFIKIESGNSKKSKRWEEIHNKNFTYKELNPGYYKLSLKLTSENNKDKIKVIRFHIKPYFWETKSFYFILLLFTTVVIIFLFFFYKERIKKKYLLINKMNDLELKALKSQMNPHFIFNTLNGLQSIMFTKNEMEINNYFIKFSKLLRTTLDILNSDKVTLYKEINYLKSYIELEQTRKINNFSYSITIDELIDLKSIEIPVMLLQPLVENAIEHGINKIKQPGELKIEIKQNDNYFIIAIEDNGNGINTEKLNPKNYLKEENSYACKIIKDRIKIMNIINKNKYKIEWVNLNIENKRGTRVILYIRSK